MAKGPEATLKDALLKELKTRYPSDYWVKIHGGIYQRGLPDIIGCYRGLFIAIELKAGKGKTTVPQEYNLSLIKKSGGICGVAYSVAQALDLVEIAVKKAKRLKI